MMLAVVILALAALLASGVLFRHQRMLTFLAAAGVLFQGAWLVLTLLDRVFFVAAATPTVWLVGSVVALVIWLFQWKHFRLPYQVAAGSGRRDIPVLLVLGVSLAAAWLVAGRNGFKEQAWVTHGFSNGYTATFQGLVQKSQLTD